MTQPPVLLIGGGKTGARVRRRLRARGIPTRSASRSTPIAFDWRPPDGWDAAPERVEKAYITRELVRPALLRRLSARPHYRGRTRLAGRRCARILRRRRGYCRSRCGGADRRASCGKTPRSHRPALTFAEAIADIAAAIGRSVRYRRIPVAEFATRRRELQLPDDLVALLCELFTVVLDGRHTAMASGVETALGRPLRDFAEFEHEAVLRDAWRP